MFYFLLIVGALILCGLGAEGGENNNYSYSDDYSDDYSYNNYGCDDTSNYTPRFNKSLVSQNSPSMKEYNVKFWTNKGNYAGAKISAATGAQAMDIVRNSYDVDHIVNWENAD